MTSFAGGQDVNQATTVCARNVSKQSSPSGVVLVETVSEQDKAPSQQPEASDEAVNEANRKRRHSTDGDQEEGGGGMAGRGQSYKRRQQQDARGSSNRQAVDAEKRRQDKLVARHWYFTNLGRCKSRGILGSRAMEFTVASYNILAQNLLHDNKDLYDHAKAEHLTWEYRSSGLLREIQSRQPDILCLQEVMESAYKDFFSEKLKKFGYRGEYIKRSRDKLDGCATFFKSSKFVLDSVSKVNYFRREHQLLDRDNVGLVLLLRPLANKSNALCVGNTHLLFNPGRGDVKLVQLQMLLAEINKLVATDDASIGWPVLLCGDFNSVPFSYLYDFLVDGKLRYSGMQSHVVSGQNLKRSSKVMGNVLMPALMGINDSCEYMEPSGENQTPSQNRQNATLQNVVPSMAQNANTRMMQNTVAGIPQNSVPRVPQNPFPIMGQNPVLRTQQSPFPTMPQNPFPIMGQNPVLRTQQNPFPAMPQNPVQRMPQGPMSAVQIQLLLANLMNQIQTPQNTNASATQAAPANVVPASNGWQVANNSPTPSQSSSTASQGGGTPSSASASSLHTKNRVQGSGTLRQTLNLKSVYDHEYFKDKQHVSEVTTCHHRAKETVDYIFYSVKSKDTYFKKDKVHLKNVVEGNLKLLGKLQLLTVEEVEEFGKLPNDLLSSDHIMLMAKFHWDFK